MLTGDAKAGATYFNGDGKCTTCHSTTGNLAGIGTRLEPIDIQQRFLFPSAGRGGAAAAVAPEPLRHPRLSCASRSRRQAVRLLSGALIQMDDFFVSLRQDDGTQRTIRRVAGMKVERQDPFAFHIALLDRLTDKNMHDIVAYLETLK